MQSLKISTGVVSLQILDDDGNERGIFKFNPEDIKSARAVLDLQKELTSKNAEYEERAKACTTADEQVALMAEVCDYFRGAIDSVFGVGSSNILFGDANTLSMFEDFFTGITPYYQKASKARLAKYKKSGK